ncbi:hypothetical protein PENTCL1PPCAC_28004, partial [Pristionchus entomophagus]
VPNEKKTEVVVVKKGRAMISLVMPTTDFICSEKAMADRYALQQLAVEKHDDRHFYEEDGTEHWQIFGYPKSEVEQSRNRRGIATREKG